MITPGSPLPARLLVPGVADTFPQPVESPCAQHLPLGELSFENLQRLCVRLLTATSQAVQCQEYGLPGQKQAGIDLYSRKPAEAKIEVWQCKRYKKLTASVISTAVAEFEQGQILELTSKFVLVTSAATEDKALADADIAAADALRKHSVEFTLLGRTQLTTMLKEHPRIVDDFFGRYWVEACCGKTEASLLGQRLSADQVSQYRKKLGALYSALFEQADSFLARSLTSTGDQTSILPLPRRWVMPTISYRTNVLLSPIPENTESAHNETDSRKPSDREQRSKPKAAQSVSTEMMADAFLASTERGVVLGSPGHGKSALLRVLALDLLSDSPFMRAAVTRFGTRLPVWLPFAFVSTRVAAGDSIADAGAAWIKKNGGDESLAKLLRQAIEDDRLLLLVDGLDEWSDPDRARETVLALQGFLSQSKAACFVTARPLGYERLDRLSGDWKHGSLQSLSTDQQHALARVIFDGVRTTASDAYRQIEAEKFSRQLQSAQSLTEMAGTPLLLVGMVSLWIRHQVLPDSRLDVCEALVKEMLEDHPSKRAAISASIQTLTSITPQVRRAALASLAWTVHSSREGAYVERTAAEQCFCSFFEESEGLAHSEAKSQARQMLPISDQIIGILSEASPGGDIHFVHRTFQELLAAEHLSSRPVGEQVQHCADKAADPAWHQVLLFLLQKSNRRVDTDALVEAMRQPQPKLRDAFLAKLLLAEAVFAPIQMSAKRRAELAEGILDEIEHGTWRPFREALLERVLPAQRGSNVYTLLIERLRVWTPKPGSLHVHEALAGWPENTGAEVALWSQLNYEDIYNQIRAARSLGRRCKGQEAWRERLLKRLHEPLSVEGLGATLLALAEGWSDHDDVVAAFKKGIKTDSTEVVLPCVLGLVRSGTHDHNCKETLIRHGDSIFFREVATEAALLGWPGDEDIKNAALLGIRSGYQRQNGAFDRDAAWEIAVEGFPGDGEVAKALVGELESKYTRFGNYLDQQKVIRAFSGHPEILTACEAYLAKSDLKDCYHDSPVAALAKTEASKKLLIEWTLRDNWMGSHALAALLSAWGLQDEEVSKVADRIRTDPSFVGHYARHLAPLEANSNEKRQKLLQAFKHISPKSSISEFGPILEALKPLRTAAPDDEVIEAAFECLNANREYRAVHHFSYALIKGFGDHPKVKALAMEWTQDIDCSWGALAEAYREDVTIRGRVTGFCQSIPEELRVLIACHCRQHAARDPDIRAIAETFRLEEDSDVRLMGAVAVAEASISNGEDTSALADYFTKELEAFGHHYHERVPAAVAGLIALNETARLRDKLIQNTRFKFHFPYSRRQRHLLPKFMVRHWTQLKVCFGADLANRFQDEGDLDSLRNAASELGFRQVADELSLLIRERTGNEKIPLETLAKEQAPGWIDACLASMGLVGGSGNSGAVVSDRHEAACILAEYGAGNDSIRIQLEQFVREGSHWSGGAIEALARGWPHSEVLMEKWKAHSSSENNGRLPAAMYAATCASPTEFVAWLRQWIVKYADSLSKWEFGNGRWFVKRRCSGDREVAEMLLKLLESSDSVSEWVSLPWLLQVGPLENAKHNLQEWAERKWSELVEKEWCLFGFNIFQGDYVPLKENLLELLLTNKRYD